MINSCVNSLAGAQATDVYRLWVRPPQPQNLVTRTLLSRYLPASARYQHDPEGPPDQAMLTQEHSVLVRIPVRLKALCWFRSVQEPMHGTTGCAACSMQVAHLSSA